MGEENEPPVRSGMLLRRGAVRKARQRWTNNVMMSEFREELERLETEILIRYAVREEEQAEAVAVVDRYRSHPAASRLLHTYYLALPEAREEMATDIRLVAEKQGTCLFAVKTTNHEYLYLGSEMEALYLGELKEGLEDEQVLRFFGWRDPQTFAEEVADCFEELPPVPVLKGGGETGHCVACGVAEGEMHVLGCPVEQCPWCGSQLSRCNCRFDQLDVDRIDTEEQVDRFAALLEQKGRIAFASRQNPSYPTAGNDPAPGKLKDRPK